MNELERAFSRMGARVVVNEGNGPLLLDVRRDRHGERFIVTKQKDEELVVLDVQPKERHLLLLARKGKEKHRFLAGHDERHWFVAGIPEVTPVSTVRDSKEVLKPKAVRENSDGVIRQGEWFFVPRPNAQVDKFLILQDEPLTRGRGSKPHRCQELVRTGGTTVYVRGTKQLIEEEYLKLPVKDRMGWRSMRRNPHVLVRGWVRHTDHKTIILNGWHEVMMNTEAQSAAMKNVAMLD
jgi:hypothetical protein